MCLKKTYIVFVLFALAIPFARSQETCLNANALDFDGVDDYVEIPNSASLCPEEFTVELWAKSHTKKWNSTGSLISKRDAYVMHPLEGSWLFQVIVFKNKIEYNVEYTSDFDITRWNHYAATFDGKTIKLYFNGVLVSEDFSKRVVSTYFAGSKLYIGRDSKIEHRYFSGTMDEVRIWNYPRTEEHIRRLMWVELEGSEKGLVAYYDFNQEADTILYDRAGSNHGKLRNFNFAPNLSNWVKTGVKIRGKGEGDAIFYEVFSKDHLLIFSALVFVVILFFVVRIYQQKKIRRRLEEQVASQTQELLEENRIKDSLINEIHHRVKNNLQTISSLIYMQREAITNPESKKSFVDIQLRINSMALMHEMLYSERDIENVSMEKYIQELVVTIDKMVNTSRQNIRFELKIDALSFPVDKSIAIGMFTNEVISNAIKYAFKGVKDSCISVVLKDEKESIFYQISDNGTGFKYKEKASESLGMKLIDIFARQLRAQKKVETSSGGVKIALTIPKSSL